MLIETPIRLQETGNAQEPVSALFVFQQTLLLQVIPHGSPATTPGQASHKWPKILRWGKKAQQGELWRFQLSSGESLLSYRGLWWANTPRDIFQMRPELQNAPSKSEAELCYGSSTHTQPAQNSLAPKTALKSQAEQCPETGLTPHDIGLNTS